MGLTVSKYFDVTNTVQVLYNLCPRKENTGTILGKYVPFRYHVLMCYLRNVEKKNDINEKRVQFY